jgi:nucleotide-binding universal stress UspA family protein
MFFQRILHPTDFSELSNQALAYAATLAHDHGGQLLILHAVETLGPEKVTYGEAVSRLEPENYRERLWAELRQVKPPLPDLAVEYILSEGDTATAILTVAAERDCDLIVLGSHGDKGFLKRLLLGSVVEQVVRKAGCGVLVVKACPGPAPPPAKAGDELHPHELTERGRPAGQ